MRDQLADAIEGAGELAAQGAKLLADAISGNTFSEYEAGDWLACVGADDLAESLGRMECDGPDAADVWVLPDHPFESAAWGLTGRCPNQGAMCNCTGACLRPQTGEEVEALNGNPAWSHLVHPIPAVATPPAAADDPAGGTPPTPAGSLTFGDLAEAARIVDHYATELLFIRSADEPRIKALANRLGDASEADPNP